jgi:hypothetical protein
MNDRTALGAADVSDEELTGMVADLLGADPAVTVVLDAAATPVDYAVPSITTAGRHWVRGTASVDGERRPFSLFVKHVQSWARSPFFADVPPDLREMAEAGVPWRTEPLAYRSDLRDRLPAGLSMPRALGVYDLDEKSAAVWLEEVTVRDVAWDLARFEHAAELLGRLAGSPAVAPYARVGESPWTLDTYLYGRLLNQVLPTLRAEPLWQHPLIAGAFDDDLHRRLLAAADQAPAYVAELATFPSTAGHGDACPNNLLVGDGPGFTLIDFGFWQLLPVGFDLGQLLVGDVQLGLRSSDDLAERGEACLVAYHAGLAAEGFEISLDRLHRAHALHLMIFTGLSTLPFELLEQEITPQLEQLAADRAAIARYSLGLLDATG